MSEPKRYDVGMTTEFNPHGFNHSFPRVYEAEQGKYVEYEDYAILKAEVDRLTKQNALATPRHLIASQDIKTLREQIEELKLENSQYEEHHKYGQNVITSLREEVERLTNAGDAMAFMMAYEKDSEFKGFVKAWNAAKEGKGQP